MRREVRRENAFGSRNTTLCKKKGRLAWLSGGKDGIQAAPFTGGGYRLNNVLLAFDLSSFNCACANELGHTNSLATCPPVIATLICRQTGGSKRRSSTCIQQFPFECGTGRILPRSKRSYFSSILFFLEVSLKLYHLNLNFIAASDEREWRLQMKMLCPFVGLYAACVSSILCVSQGRTYFYVFPDRIFKSFLYVFFTKIVLRFILPRVGVGPPPNTNSWVRSPDGVFQQGSHCSLENNKKRTERGFTNGILYKIIKT